MNGQVEKDQATLAESARAMLRGRNVPDKYWPLALQTAAFLKNRTPHDTLGGRLPVEAGTGEAFEPCRLYTFGCAAYAQMEKEETSDGRIEDVDEEDIDMLMSIILRFTRGEAGKITRPFARKGDGVGAWRALTEHYGNECKDRWHALLSVQKC